jgi:Planctomycete cytochrome C/Anaphase-promoting complex subunit 4 WD40 domain
MMQFNYRRRLIRPPGNARGCRVLACAAGFVLFIQIVAASAAEEKVTYDDQLAPILRQRCSSCHNSNTKKADLDVTNYSGLMRGGSSGPSIEPGDPDSSHLFMLVTRQSEPFMPQNADKLPDAEIDLIRRWIKGGALENAGSKAAMPKAKKIVVAESTPGKRPEVIPLPPRMVLEPAFQMSKAPIARSLATSPWAPLVAVASQRQVLLYNTTTLELVGVYPFLEGQPNVVRFSRDGRLLLAGGGRPGASGKVVVWDITTGERAFEVGNELDIVLAADVSADHKRIALAGPQRVVKIYSTETGQMLHEMAKHTDWVLSAEFSPDGVLLATADRNGGLCVWEAATGHEYLTLAGHTAAVNAISWRGDSNILASASEDATLRLWEMENGTAVKNWNAKTPLLALDFTRDGRLVTSGRDQITRIWNQEGKQLTETKPIGELAVSVGYSDESNRAITASLAGAVQVYQDDKPEALGSLVTNPPPLYGRLAAAKILLEQKTKAMAPLAGAKSKAQADVAATQASLTAAQQKLTGLKSNSDKLAGEVKQIGAARAASDADRTKAATSIQQIESAKPSVAEALRHLTEALGKLPNDAKLAATQRALNDELKGMEASSTALQTKVTELTAALADADARLKETNARLEAANKEVAASTEQVKSLEAGAQKLAATLQAAQTAAAPAEKELAAASDAVARWQNEIAFRDRMAALVKDLEAAKKIAIERQAVLDKATQQLAGVQSAVDSAKLKVNEASQGVNAASEKIQQARSKK